jgi:hypothetical protein
MVRAVVVWVGAGAVARAVAAGAGVAWVAADMGKGLAQEVREVTEVREEAGLHTQESGAGR